MRIAEIAVVGPGAQAKYDFIKAVSDELEIQNESLIFGRIQINDQLILHLYGLDYSETEFLPSWDLVTKKLLGYVVLFNWGEKGALSTVKSLLDTLAHRYSLPLIVVANLVDGETEFPARLLDKELNLSDQSHFVFCNVSDPASVKNALIILINTVLEQLK